MKEKSVVIIGGGIAGLSVGCYLQMNGYKTQVFEMHDKPGGLCTAWDRKGYTIDGCLQWLWGSSPKHNFYPLWEEMGIIQGMTIINMEELMRIEAPDGKVFHLYTDADRLERHMKELAPEDSALIEEFVRAIRHFSHFQIPVEKSPELYSLVDYLRFSFNLLPYMGDYRKWSKMSIGDMARRFKNPFLREAWQRFWIPAMSSWTLLNSLSPMHNKSAGYPVGGSMVLSHAIEKRYFDLGGKINYKKKVDHILVENNQATGIRLADGIERPADYVISAADGQATIFEMLGGQYVNEKIRGYYKQMPVFQPLIYIGLGVNRSFEDMDKIIAGINLSLHKTLVIGGQEHKSLHVRIHNFDPTMAPAGKTMITCEVDSDYSYWESLRKDINLYKAEKERIANQIIAILDKRFPGLANQVEMHDVATPTTFRRYTGNWQGSYEGWLPTTKIGMTFSMKKTLPGLSNFYMVGQWVMPGGGLPTCVLSGRWVTQMICKADRKKFVATKS